ncbi:MAG TPA: NADH-quinone oxidoreductase subunit NuoE [Chitinispirillaceae bacterium]|jgi:NADH-quinone oxidoreductase subunit E|nr:NADH-quinone oxidoreductase subunit NuoE [Chitinispirillaceae bacterium]
MEKTTQQKAIRKFTKICNIVSQYNRDKSKLIPILQKVQDEYRYLPEEVLTFVATTLDIPPATVYGVATFYAHFTLSPRGKYVIRICDGTACHVKGSNKLLETLREKLNLKDKNTTTSDMLFTLETVSCLGACGLAPVLVINDVVHGQVTREKAIKLIDEIIEKENKNAG